MTRKNNTLWEQGTNCVTLLVLVVINFPFMTDRVKRTLTPVILLILVSSLFYDSWKRSGYSKGELEREKRDERNRMIQAQAVWYCHVAEDWILLGVFAVFSLFLHNEAVTYTLMWVLAARSFLSFGIRWWLNRKY